MSRTGQETGNGSVRGLCDRGDLWQQKSGADLAVVRWRWKEGRMGPVRGGEMTVTPSLSTEDSLAATRLWIEWPAAESWQVAPSDHDPQKHNFASPLPPPRQPPASPVRHLLAAGRIRRRQCIGLQLWPRNQGPRTFRKVHLAEARLHSAAERGHHHDPGCHAKRTGNLGIWGATAGGEGLLGGDISSRDRDFDVQFSSSNPSWSPG
jgi:hypothetical protein